jgi:hypothetical protein
MQSGVGAHDLQALGHPKKKKIRLNGKTGSKKLRINL